MECRGAAVPALAIPFVAFEWRTCRENACGKEYCFEVTKKQALTDSWCVQLGCAVAIVLITYFKLSHLTNFGVNLGARACRGVSSTCKYAGICEQQAHCVLFRSKVSPRC